MNSKHDAEKRYENRRIRAYASAAAALRQDITATIQLKFVNADAMGAWEATWRPHQSRIVQWNWHALAQQYQSRPERFEVAIWCANALCGLAIGSVSHTIVHVNFLEGSPIETHPLRGYITGIAIASAEHYAVTIGRQEVRLQDPLPALIARYAKFGYSLVNLKGEHPYCGRRI